MSKTYVPIALLRLVVSRAQMAKGSDIASIDPGTLATVRFYHPRQDCWMNHFRISTETGLIEPLTAVGRSTAQLLQINRTESVEARALLLSIGKLTVPKYC